MRTSPLETLSLRNGSRLSDRFHFRIVFKVNRQHLIDDYKPDHRTRQCFQGIDPDKVSHIPGDDIRWR